MSTIIFIGIVLFVLKTELYTLRCRWENLFWFVIWVNKPFKVLLDLYIHPHATLCHCIISVSYPVYFYRRIKRQWPWMLVETFQLFVVIASGSAGRLKRQLLLIETKTMVQQQQWQLRSNGKGRKSSTLAHTNILATLSPAAPLDLLTDYEKLQSITPDPILPLWLANPAKSPRGAWAPDKHGQMSLRWLWTCYFHVSLF